MSDFHNQLAQLPREDLLEIIKEQDPKLYMGVNRIEWVFENKLRHLSWPDGSVITGRPVTNEELALLIDEPFRFSAEMERMGFDRDTQKKIHIAKDPVLWSRHYLKIEPRVYQILILRNKKNRKVLRAGRRLGKALSIDTPIPSPNGWRTMKDLEVGDQVFDEQGMPCNITNVTDVQWDRECYRVSFSDGSSMIADADHLWTVDTKQSRKARGRAKTPQSGPITLTTRQMVDDLYVWSGNKYEVNYSIEVAGPVQYQSKNLPIPPYVLGAWLGDGTSINGSITSIDQEIIDAIKSYGYTVDARPSCDISYNVVGLSKELNALGIRRDKTVSKEDFNKRIPRVYLEGSVEQRTDLLMGLMDTDGSVVCRKSGGVEFSVVDEVLANDVWELVKSLGYKATIRKDPAKLNGVQHGYRYRIFFTPWKPVFKLNRKLALQKLRDKPSARQRCRYVTAIEAVDSVPVKCIAVDSPNNLYLAGDNFITTHNSFTLIMALLHYSFTHNNGRCIVVAPMKSQVEVLYTELLRLARASDVVFSTIVRKVTSPQFFIEFSNGSTIKFFTSGIRCLTPDHDVMTLDRGWTPISEVQPGETVLSLDNGQLLWSKAEAVLSYDYDGPLIVHNGQQLSFRVTPNHKFLASPNSSGPPKYRMVQADELKDSYHIPVVGEALLAASKEYSGDELELWGWWLAEGAGKDGNKTRFSQNDGPGLERIKELIESLGFDWKYYQYGDKAAELRTYWKPPIFSGTNCYDKFIPRELLGEEHRDRLLIGMLGGDGYFRRKGWEYSSSSWRLINDVQELAIGLGWRANLREKKIKYRPVGGGEPNRRWRVSAYPYSYATINDDKLTTEYYSGKVYCLTVPETGVFLTRHNGKVHITGNSGGKADVVRGQEAHLIVLDELDYMHSDDLESLYAMLQKTDEDQEEKQLIGASTPTGRREMFWKWCLNERFQEFWFPSYVNPNFEKASEDEFREIYSTMGYRHEIEADWGEDAEGVYPRRYVDFAFNCALAYLPEDTDVAIVKKESDWIYEMPLVASEKSFYIMGVDWDKYGAGTNIAIIEICAKDYNDKRFRNKIKFTYHEEVPRDEFTLSKAVDRIIFLNQVFNPEHIYVDRGYGELQVEMLHKYGAEHPETKLKTKLKGISFAETIEMRDPGTKELVKKEIKPFMVDNLRQLLERQEIVFPSSDETLYLQLISYIVARITQHGRPIFESTGDSGDHIHDALILACYAFTKNYGDLMKTRRAYGSKAISNEAFLATFQLSNDKDTAESEKASAEKTWGDVSNAPIEIQRKMTNRNGRRNRSSMRPIQRKMF